MGYPCQSLASTVVDLGFQMLKPTSEHTKMMADCFKAPGGQRTKTELITFGCHRSPPWSEKVAFAWGLPGGPCQCRRSRLRRPHHFRLAHISSDHARKAPTGRSSSFHRQSDRLRPHAIRSFNLPPTTRSPQVEHNPIIHCFVLIILCYSMTV